MAIKTYTKGTAAKLSENFKSTEFDCHGSGCCTTTSIDETLVKYLQQIRNHFGKAVNISSGYRCTTHNKNVGGATGSRHARGQAADIYINGVAPAEIAKYAESIGVLGIGLYETKVDGYFVHIDTRSTKSFWYGQAQAKRDTFGGATNNNIKIEIPKEGENGKMKYNENNKPLVCMQTQSTCYKGTSKMEIKGVLWHSTGANNPTLKRYVQPSDDAQDKEAWLELLGVNKYGNDWNHITRQAGLNCWIGKLADGTVATVQTMPWDFKPWGCGSGKKGSCNNGWIQFEICEDGLTDKDYFNKVYKEACEITAYLCDMYNIDPHGTVEYNGVNVPTILCHYDSYKLGLGSNHGDVDHWFPKFGKSMETVRDDVEKLLPKKAPVIEPVLPEPELYRVRKQWEDAKSQIGAYKDLNNAKEACDKAGDEYEVYNSKGIAIYPERIVTEPDIKTGFIKGDVVKLLPDAVYSSGMKIPSWVFRSKLYVRDVRKNGLIVISTQKTGAVTGVVESKYLIDYKTATVAPVEPTFTPYLVRITEKVLNVRAGAGTNYKITTQVRKNEIYTIVAENGKWGKLKSGAGWIHLDYTKKV